MFGNALHFDHSPGSTSRGSQASPLHALLVLSDFGFLSETRTRHATHLMAETTSEGRVRKRAPNAYVDLVVVEPTVADRVGADAPDVYVSGAAPMLSILSVHDRHTCLRRCLLMLYFRLVATSEDPVFWVRYLHMNPF